MWSLQGGWGWYLLLCRSTWAPGAFGVPMAKGSVTLYRSEENISTLSSLAVKQYSWTRHRRVTARQFSSLSTEEPHQFHHVLTFPIMVSQFFPLPVCSSWASWGFMQELVQTWRGLVLHEAIPHKSTMIQSDYGWGRLQKLRNSWAIIYT